MGVKAHHRRQAQAAKAAAPSLFGPTHEIQAAHHSPSQINISNHHNLPHPMKTLIIIASLAAASFLSSCSAPAPVAAAPTSAISCSKCGTVYFKSPSTTAAAGGKGYVVLKSSSKMTCPDCDNQVIAWVKTGAFTEHVCKTCGTTLKHCSSH
jgi:ribosomal protein S27E